MRFNVLDSWRGFAALLVATYHFEATSHIYDVAFFRNAYLFVDFFFVLSGFVIAHAYADRIRNGREFAGFTIRRFGRLYPLHASVLLAFIAVEAFKLILSSGFGIAAGTPAFDPDGYTPLATLPGHFALTTALGIHNTLTWNGPDWSINAEFWTYIVFALIVLTAGRFRTLAIAGAGIVAAMILISRSTQGIDATYDLGFVRCIYGFMLGQLIYTLRRNLPADRIGNATALELTALAATIAFISFADRGPTSFAAPLVFAAATLVFSYEKGAISGFFQRPVFHALGDWSYSIYMVHAFVWFVAGMAISVAGRKFGIDPWQILWTEGLSRRVLVIDNKFVVDLMLVAYLAIVLVLASLTRRYIEDPGRRYFATVARRIEKPSAAATKTHAGHAGSDL